MSWELISVSMSVSLFMPVIFFFFFLALDIENLFRIQEARCCWKKNCGWLSHGLRKHSIWNGVQPFFFFLTKTTRKKNEGSLPTIKLKACVFNGDEWTLCLVRLTLFIRDTYMFCLMVQLSVHQWQKKVMSASSAVNRTFRVLFCSAKEIEFGSWTSRYKSMIWKSQMAFLSYAEGCKELEGAIERYSRTTTSKAVLIKALTFSFMPTRV